jgi:hypothetical protein
MGQSQAQWDEATLDYRLLMNSAIRFRKTMFPLKPEHPRTRITNGSGIREAIKKKHGCFYLTQRTRAAGNYGLLR